MVSPVGSEGAIDWLGCLGPLGSVFRGRNWAGVRRVGDMLGCVATFLFFKRKIETCRIEIFGFDATQTKASLSKNCRAVLMHAGTHSLICPRQAVLLPNLHLRPNAHLVLPWHLMPLIFRRDSRTISRDTDTQTHTRIQKGVPRPTMLFAGSFRHTFCFRQRLG